MESDGGRVPERLRLWSLSEDVLVEAGPPGDPLVAITRWGDIRIDDPSPAVRDALHRMSFGPVAVANLPREEGEAGPDGSELGRLERVLGRLASCVVQSLGLDDEPGPVLSVAPVSPQAPFWSPGRLDPALPVRLSRYVTARASRGELVLESPLSRYRVLLHRPLAAWVVGSLAATTTAGEVAALLRTPLPVVADVLAYLVAGGMVLTGDPAAPDRFAEDTDALLTAWTPHELAFHGSTRLGRYDPEPPRARAEPSRPRAEARRPGGPRYPLRRPRPTAPQTAAGRAARAAAGPRRGFSARPLDAGQVGELLFRLVRGSWLPAAGRPPGPGPDDAVGPGPALALYVTLDRCDGLPRGTFRYDPARHELALISSAEADLAELLDTATVTTGSTLRPPALITVTTRMGELAHRYDGTAYSATLRHVGALQRTLDLAAVGMGLASAALALTDRALADDVLRLDYPAEVSVAEMTVGIAV